MRSKATDADLARMQLIMRKMTNFRLGHSTRLVDGLYYEHRLMRDNKWVLSIYRNELTPGNDIEVSIDVPPLIWPDDANSARVRSARNWLERQRSELENLPSEMHAHQVPNAFRIGVLVPKAFEFLERLQQQFAIRDERERWRVDFAEAAPVTEVLPAQVPIIKTPTTAPAQDFASKTVERMLRTVLQTCAQSGKQSVVIAKYKRFLFASEDEFRRIIAELLAASGGRCALTGVELDMTERDSDLAPSLDRVDSNGHYEPGNVQVVAQFANRWKSDDTDEHFLRLLKLVRRDRDVDSQADHSP